jgi:hypothetical protein
MNDLSHEADGLTDAADAELVARQAKARADYDLALNYARFQQKRFNDAMQGVFNANSLPALAAARLAGVRLSANDFAHAHYCLLRSYLDLCDAMDWDDDDALLAGVISEVKL